MSAQGVRGVKPPGNDEMNRLSARRAALAYTVIAVVMTWPLARHLTTRLPADLGDPPFNCWVMMWTGGQILAALSGHVSALGDYWNGNIFHPQPLTIAYSEHLTPEMLQALPFFAPTRNIFLGYNVVFLSTFVLAGLGMFLLVREWTCRPLAGFVAGLAFAYAPYRLAQITHVQVLSTQWMPFALYGIRRAFAARRPRAVAGAAAALTLQNLSCGYYMLYFTPFAAAYWLYEIAARRIWHDRRVWLASLSVVAIVALVTLPFVLPYFRVRHMTWVGVRSIDDMVNFSADTHAFVAAPQTSRLWASRLPNRWNPEGEGFPGVTTLALAIAGTAWAGARIASDDWKRLTLAARWAVTGAAFVFVPASALLIALFAHGQVTLPSLGAAEILRGSDRPLRFAAGSLGVLLLIRAIGRRRGASPDAPRGAGFCVLALGAAALFALGPHIQAMGHRLGAGPYAWLVGLPGFDGLRVPARLLMVVSLFTATLAGFGAAWLLGSRRMPPWTSRAMCAAAATGILAESFMAPLPLNTAVEAPGYRPVQTLDIGRRLPGVYRAIRQLPDPIVLLELPIGEPAYDISAEFYAGLHRRPIVNGYSGFWPPYYFRRANLYMRATEDPPEVWRMLAEDGVTHVLVHENAFADRRRGEALSGWLRSMGATLVFQDGGDELFQVAPVPPKR